MSRSMMSIIVRSYRPDAFGVVSEVAYVSYKMSASDNTHLAGACLHDPVWKVERDVNWLASDARFVTPAFTEALGSRL